MFKSEKHNLIANILVWILVLIVVFNTIRFDPPLWFNILMPAITAIPIFKSIYKLRRGDEA
ncbi:hypothetical protein [Jeotgalibacillus terrae]|uniref:Uncharacterized protein n=1 Tax=Jeotgalibacillus terrae TaxID=587735 RepID=A0ABW5ZI96_9BACL|nr:hypothetical protein [Jeotgalibacillus terrae]MBM7578636.1 hypothetical protein [Jeotgalibacillus terrae]